MRRLTLLCAAIALFALAVGTTSRTPAAQTDEGTYEACRPGNETISATALPETVDLERCPVGERAIRDNGIGTVLPAPGQGVYVHALTVTGSEELEVTRTRDGTLELEDVGDETEAARIESAARTASSSGECSDRAYTDRDYAVKGDPVWYFNPRTTPNELSRRSALRAIRSGTANILTMRNSCGRGNVTPGKVSMAYNGSTRDHAGIGANGGCENDRKTVVSFGKLPESALAVTCTYFSEDPGYERVHWSDTMLNKTSHNWTTRPGSGCKGKYDLESTVTHERGHTFGLGHVSESSHARLTMSHRSNGPCQSSERSLGLGDWKGLCGKYRDPRDC